MLNTMSKQDKEKLANDALAVIREQARILKYYIVDGNTLDGIEVNRDMLATLMYDQITIGVKDHKNYNA